MPGTSPAPASVPTSVLPGSATEASPLVLPQSFELERYFAGSTRAWGIVQDRFGRLRRSFVVDMNGRWDGALLVLDEKFVYDDGSTSERTWRVRKTGPSSYEGESADIVGKAVGRVEGAVVTWRYRLRLPLGRRLWTIRFHDMMYLLGDGVMINRAEMRKFGIRVGGLTLAFRRLDAAAVDQSLGSSRRVTANASG